MHGLPAPASGHPGGHGDMHEYRLKLPAGFPAPYQFVELDWNPAGHGEPYLQPHFDFQFYTISLEERNSIVPSDPQFAAKASNFPAPEYIRPGFVCPCTILGIPAPQMAVPRMGLHWLDANAPELRGAPFTATWINGTWDGKVIFEEPMITRDFILSASDTTFLVPLPQSVQKRGYYPGAYRVAYDAKAREYRIALTNLVGMD